MILTKAIIRWRIKRLNSTIYKMNSASAKVNDFINSVGNLEKTLGNNIKIDDKLPYQEYYKNSCASMNNVKNNLSGKIVPSLYYRIDQYKKQLEE